MLLKKAKLIFTSVRTLIYIPVLEREERETEKSHHDLRVRVIACTTQWPSKTICSRLFYLQSVVSSLDLDTLIMLCTSSIL